MLLLLFNLWNRIHAGNLAGSFDTFPLPNWMRVWLSRYPMQQRVAIYARVMEGRDLTSLAPDELGCAESVSRILVQWGLSPSVVTGTWTLQQELQKNKNFKRISEREVTPGCVIIAATGEGNGKIKNGHVGIVGENLRIWSNNSSTGKWDNHLTVFFFKNHYGLAGGYPVYYYKIIN